MQNFIKTKNHLKSKVTIISSAYDPDDSYQNVDLTGRKGAEIYV